MSTSGKAIKLKGTIDERILDFSKIAHVDGCFDLQATFRKSGFLDYFKNVQDDIHFEEWKEFYKNGNCDKEDEILTKVKDKEIRVTTDLISSLIGCPNSGLKVYTTDEWMTQEGVSIHMAQRLLFQEREASDPCNMIPKARVLQVFNKYCLVPKGGSKQELREVDCGLLYNLLMEKEINLPHLLFEYLYERIETHLSDPHPLHNMISYGMLVTKIMKHFGVPLGEPTIEKTKIECISQRSFTNMDTVSVEVRKFRENIGKPVKKRGRTTSESDSTYNVHKKKKFQPKVVKDQQGSTPKSKGESSKAKVSPVQGESSSNQSSEANWADLVYADKWVSEDSSDEDYSGNSSLPSNQSVSDLSNDRDIDLTDEGRTEVYIRRKFIPLTEYMKEYKIATRKRKKLVKELVFNYHQVRKENSAPGLREMTLTPEERWRYIKSLKKDAPIPIPERSPSPSPPVVSISPSTIPISGSIGNFSVQPSPLKFEGLGKLSFIDDQPARLSPRKISYPSCQIQEVGSSSMSQPQVVEPVPNLQVENLVGNKENMEDEIFGDILKEISHEEQQQQQVHENAHEGQDQDMVVVENQVQKILEESAPLTLETQDEESGDTIPMEVCYSDEEVFMEGVQEEVHEILTQVVEGCPSSLSGRNQVEFLEGLEISQVGRSYDFYEELPYKIIHKIPDTRRRVIRSIFEESVEKKIATVEYSEKVLPFISGLTRAFAEELERIKHHPLPDIVEEDVIVMRKPLRPHTKIFVELDVSSPPIQIIQWRNKQVMDPHFHPHPDQAQRNLQITGESGSGIQYYEKQIEGTSSQIGTLTFGFGKRFKFGDIEIYLTTFMLRLLHFVPLQYMIIGLSYIPSIFHPDFKLFRLVYDGIPPLFINPFGKLRSDFTIDRTLLGSGYDSYVQELELELECFERIAQLEKEREMLLEKIRKKRLRS